MKSPALKTSLSVLLFMWITGPASAQVVKNVIYMIGDGMGVSHVTSLIIENELRPINIERAHAVGLVRTFSANNRVTDSAAAGTALATGTKTDNGKLGIDPDGNNLTSVLTKCIRAGMKTGFAVTVSVTHATPAAFYAHAPNRSDYEFIAEQLLESQIDVFIGGGYDYFANRSDSVDMIKKLNDQGYYVARSFTERGLAGAVRAAVLAAPDDMPSVVDGRGDFLPFAVEKSIDILRRGPSSDNGFFLMVEGSQIDYAGHNNDTDYLIGEMRDFDEAVGVAFDFADRYPGTLVVVLADHETGGLCLPSGDSDFISAEKGIEYRYGTGSHTAALIPLFAYGTGASEFSKVMDNTDVPRIISRLLFGE